MRPERYVVLRPPPGFAHRKGQAWEQVVLPARAAALRAALIWSPANLAPLAWPRNVIVLHDAAALRNASRDSRAYRLWHSTFGIAVARRAQRIVTVSEFSRRELTELAGLDPERIVVIHGGVDQRFSPDAGSDRLAEALGLTRPYVLTVGSEDPRKNLDSLSRISARLRDTGLELVWAGGSLGHIPSNGSSNGIRRLGYVADQDLPALYAGARAFVLPSHYEGFGLPCLEAMACGTPVVAANRAALPETCGDAALLVDPDDPDEVATAVISAATDEATRTRLRSAGLRRAADNGWDRTARETDALLTSLAEA